MVTITFISRYTNQLEANEVQYPGGASVRAMGSVLLVDDAAGNQVGGAQLSQVEHWKVSKDSGEIANPAPSRGTPE